MIMLPLMPKDGFAFNVNSDCVLLMGRTTFRKTLLPVTSLIVIFIVEKWKSNVENIINNQTHKIP